jgi:chromosome partitioning protein
MKSIAVMSLKGGAGKTTLSVHLAVAAAQRGHRVLLLDTDAQQLSCVTWSNARQAADAPRVLGLEPHRLAEALEAARSDGYDLVVVDTAPHAGPAAVDVSRLVDRIVVPVRPSVFDLAAANATLDVARSSSAKTMVVLSACPPRAPEIGMARAALSKSGIPVARTEIADRRAYARAIQTGQAVSEFEPEGKAATEVSALLEEVLA